MQPSGRSTDYMNGAPYQPTVFSPKAAPVSSGVNLNFSPSPQNRSQFSYTSAYPSANVGAKDITAEVSAESAGPKRSLFRTAEDRGYTWNDEALANEGFTPAEMADLKAHGVADDTIGYFLKQGWLNDGAPEVADTPETSNAEGVYDPPEVETVPSTDMEYPAPATQEQPAAPDVPNAPQGMGDFREGNSDQAELDPVAKVLADNGISENSPNYQYYYGREYNRQKTGYASPGLFGGRGFFS